MPSYPCDKKQPKPACQSDGCDFCYAGARQLLADSQEAAPYGSDDRVASLAPDPAAPQQPLADILFTLTAARAVLTAYALTLSPVAALATFHTARGAAGIEPTSAYRQQDFLSVLKS